MGRSKSVYELYNEFNKVRDSIELYEINEQDMGNIPISDAVGVANGDYQSDVTSGIPMLDPVYSGGFVLDGGSIDGGNHIVYNGHNVAVDYVNTQSAGHSNTTFNGKTIHDLIVEALHGSHTGNDGPLSKTYNQKLDDINYSMREIEGLFNALSLVINEPSERLIFDTMFNNWKNDKFADRYKA